MREQRKNNPYCFLDSFRSQFRSKKAGDQYLFFWMFIIWIAVGLSMVAGVIMFYSITLDSGNTEAQILGSKIIYCLESNFNYSEINDANFDIYSKCAINRVAFENTSLYYMNLTVGEKISGKTSSVIKGVGLFEVQCAYQKQKNEVQKKFAQCAEYSLELFDDYGKEYSIKLLTVSNQR